MININLTPPEELENPLWMVPDILLAVLVCVIGYFSVGLYLDVERKAIDVILAEQQQIQSESAKFTPFVEQLKRLDSQLQDVNKQLSVMKGVSGELVEKYAPVIAIEHVQNLKPQGVWFTSFSISKDLNEKAAVQDGNNKAKNADAAKAEVAAKVEVAAKDGTGGVSFSAYALDHLLIAELMGSLRATKTQALEAGDMRTQVYFEDVTLVSTSRVVAPPGTVIVPVGSQLQKQPMVISFSIRMNFKTNPVKGARTIASFQDFYPVDARFDIAVR